MDLQQVISSREFFLALDKFSHAEDIFQNFLFPLKKQYLVITGDDNLRQKRLLTWVTNKFFHDSEFSVKKFQSAELSNKDIIQNLKNSFHNFSIFSQNSLVIVRDTEEIRDNALEEIISSYPTGSTNSLLIFVANKNKLKAKSIKSLSEKGLFIEIEALQGLRLESWIRKEFNNLSKLSNSSKSLEVAATNEKSDGQDISKSEIDNSLNNQLTTHSPRPILIPNELISYLVNNYEGQIDLLYQEICKIYFALSQNSSIDPYLLLSLRPKSSTFDLINSIGKKNFAQSQKILQTLEQQDIHPLQILSFLNKSFRIILYDKVSEGKKSLTSTIPQELIQSWFKKKLPSHRLFSREELVSSLSLLANVDYKIKSAGFPENFLIESLVGSLTLRKFTKKI